jgi:hypothetical protein
MRWMILTGLLWVTAFAAPAPALTADVRMTSWPDGRPQTRGEYRHDVRHGEFRTWHRNGRLAELRHYVDGREAGLQQAWTADEVMFLNYEVRGGRRYGLVNAKPCLPADDAASTTDPLRPGGRK